MTKEDKRRLLLRSVAIAATVLPCVATAQQISFTQSASGGTMRLLENRAPAVASRTDGVSAPPIPGSITRTQIGSVRADVNTNTFAPTAPVTGGFDAATASRKDGLLVERRLTATVGRSYTGTVLPSPSAGVLAPAEVSRLDEVFALSAPTLGVVSSSIAQTPFSWQCSGGPCSALVEFTGTSPGFTLRDIKTYDPNRFVPSNPDAAGTFVDMGGGPVSLNYTPIQTRFPGSATFTNTTLAAEIRIEQVFRPWRVNEALEVSTFPGPRDMTAVVTPRFGFTTAEAAALGNYAGFNWLQRITAMEADGRRLATEAERIAEFGRGLGYDPLIGGNPGNITRGDSSPLYWDVAPIGGRQGLDAASNATAMAVTFSDAPQLFERGRKVYFETSLVGVNGASFDVLADVFADDRLTFRWSFEQTEDVVWTRRLLDALGLLDAPNGGIAAMLQNIDAAFAGNGIVTFLGFGRAPDTDIVDPPQAVPAPSAILLLAAGAWGLALRRRAA